MNIDEEEKLSEEYSKKMISILSTDNDIVLYELTRENVAWVEAMLFYNSSYNSSSDTNNKSKHKNKNNKDDDNYGGSSAFWFKELKNYCDHQKTEYSMEEIIYNTVCAVDRENSTHLNANSSVSDKTGRHIMKDRIIQLVNDGTFIEMLQNRDWSYSFFEILNAEANNRKNTSFASKYCQIACYNLFDDEHKDRYSKFDSVVRKILPQYLQYYKIAMDNVDLTDYKTYSKKIDELLDKTGNRISRHGLDQLLWYCHK